MEMKGWNQSISLLLFLFAIINYDLLTNMLVTNYVINIDRICQLINYCLSKEVLKKKTNS